MSQHDGLIRAEYYVNCRFCEKAFLGLANTLIRAERVLQLEGWIKRGGRWFCGDVCADKQFSPKRECITK